MTMEVTMGNSSHFHRLLITFTLLIVVLILSSSTVEASGDHQPQWSWPVAARASGCRGSIAECVGERLNEFESVVMGQLLEVTKHISYGAMKRNMVPCSQRGQSYYNCQPGAEANPYTRGCSAITRCRT